MSAMESVGAIKTQEISPAGRIFKFRSEESGSKQNPITEGHEKRSGGAEKSHVSNSDRIERMVEAMDNYVRSIQRDLKIQVNQDTGDIVVKVLSRESGKVIREIPPENLLKLASKMEEMAGVLLQKSV
jgi:uncharacterized FlaG/YvyC family protein